MPFSPAALTTEAVSTQRSPDFEASICVRVRCHRASIIHRRPRSLPSSGFSSPGPPFLVVQPFYSAAPLMMFSFAAFAFALAAPDHLQRLLHEKIDFPSPYSRPAQGFEPAD
jgi:hypothetical protein